MTGRVRTRSSCGWTTNPPPVPDLGPEQGAPCGSALCEPMKGIRPGHGRCRDVTPRVTPTPQLVLGQPRGFNPGVPWSQLEAVLSGRPEAPELVVDPLAGGDWASPASRRRPQA